MIPSSTKREIKHFHVVVVQWRLKNVLKSVMHVQSCCFVNLNLLLCCRSCCLRRRCCLSSLMTNKCTKMRDARAKSLSLFATTIFSATQATAWQQCCDIVSNSYNIVPTLQRCVALKVVVAPSRVTYLKSQLYLSLRTTYTPFARSHPQRSCYGTVRRLHVID